MSRSSIPPELRQKVAEESRHRCGYCLTSQTVVGSPMEIDHLIPEALGGATEQDNLWLACPLCNRHKGQRTVAWDPVSRQEVSLFDPRRQKWEDHFAWSTEGAHIVGVTAVGRATVETLELNRPTLVAARRRWVAVGWHPPDD